MVERQFQKLNFYLVGFAIVMALLKFWMMVTVDSKVVVICAFLSLLLLGSTINVGIGNLVPNHVKKKICFRIDFWLAVLTLWFTMLPFGLFGLSAFFKTSFPLTGYQFTWITINRYWLLGCLITAYVVLLMVVLYLRRFIYYLATSYNKSFLQILTLSRHTASLKDVGRGLLLIAIRIGWVMCLILFLSFINYLVGQQFFFVLSLGIINLCVPLIEVKLLFRLLAIPVNSHIKLTGISVFGLFGALIFVSVLGVTYSSHRILKPAQQEIIVHRGVINNDGAPNTISALKKNSRYRFSYVEMDIQETKDHHFICAHNDTLFIPGKGQREINLLKLKTIQRYHHVDLFREYLHIANNLEQPLIVELKVTNHSDKEMGKRFAEQFGQQMLKQSNMVHSVGYNYLRQIKARYPKIRVGLVTMLNFSNLAKYKVDFYTLQHITLTPFLLRSIPSKRPVYTWTDDQSLTMKRLSMMGVDGQVTDQAITLKDLTFNQKQNYWLLILNSIVTYL